MSSIELNYPIINVVFLSGGGSATIRHLGINTYEVDITPLPDAYTVSSGTQTVYTLTEKESYTIM